MTQTCLPVTWKSLIFPSSIILNTDPRHSLPAPILLKGTFTHNWACDLRHPLSLQKSEQHIQEQPIMMCFCFCLRESTPFLSQWGIFQSLGHLRITCRMLTPIYQGIDIYSGILCFFLNTYRLFLQLREIIASLHTGMLQIDFSLNKEDWILSQLNSPSSNEKSGEDVCV